ncbi:hypothetical protein [Kitasatospora sp. NPDC050543]|uniref:hypothetical protein n=1 Tax=Kitasatospora sp. NPDC050543 TaxID=3364054 RepID=UPI0037BC456C
MGSYARHSATGTLEATGAVLRTRAVSRLEETAAELWSYVPATFPDGTPFPARPAFDEVVALGRALVRSSPPHAADLMRYCLKALAGLATVADPRTYSVRAGIDTLAARRLLRQNGMIEWEQTLTRVLLLTVEYRWQAGHVAVSLATPRKGDTADPGDRADGAHPADLGDTADPADPADGEPADGEPADGEPGPLGADTDDGRPEGGTTPRPITVVVPQS